MKYTVVATLRAELIGVPVKLSPAQLHRRRHHVRPTAGAKGFVDIIAPCELKAGETFETQQPLPPGFERFLQPEGTQWTQGSWQ